MMKRLTLLLAVTFALVLHARRSDACSDDPESALGLYAPIPALSATAPTNTRIWLPQSQEWDAPRLDPATVTITEGTTTISADATRVIVAGEIDRDVWIFTPVAPLTPGASVVVKVGTEIATTFVVGPAADLDAPSPPMIRKVDVDSGYFGGFTCPEPSRVVVTVGETAAMLVLAEGTGTALPSRVLGMTDADQIGAVALAEGDHALRLLAIDIAGNTTVVPVPSFTVPEEQSGCSATTGSGGWAAALVAMLVLGRRRRRR
jgi:MYXO-CTERM domain-containing protein